MWEYYIGVAGASGWVGFGSLQNQQGGHVNAQMAAYSQYNQQCSHLNQIHQGAAFPVFPTNTEPAVTAKDCEGCGAPSSRYQPVCEYCRRPR